ncbi:DNA topoisomerase IV subunit A [Thermoproteus uzoniensis]|uniref:DNA topoisomerase IV subunit A n=1 Tax=Thermoproteus uzoniensis TaxID=184117 RepID=UPI00069A67C4|nr:DNA topoisomerase IV subunit A [Thermoproteus uzoniensis]
MSGRADFLKRLEEWGAELAKSALSLKEPVMEIPARTLSNTIWDEKARMLRLGPEKIHRRFLDVKESRRFMQTVLMLRLIVDAIRADVYPTIRDLYYNGKHTIVFKDPLGRVHRENTWDEQAESNGVIEDIEVATNILREEMGISADVKGKVVGPIVVRSQGYELDASKFGETALSLPVNVDALEIVKVEASYVLVIEKDAIFQRLVREKFWSQENAVLITAKGMPDRATRRFVKRLNEEYRLPVYVLTDGDPYGIYIYSVYKSGSIKLSYESERLATPKAKFLGVAPLDIERYKIPDQFVIRATDRDIKRAQELLKYPWFQNDVWKKELEYFLKTKKKVEIEALSAHGLKYLHDYIKDKIRGNKFID